MLVSDTIVSSLTSTGNIVLILVLVDVGLGHLHVEHADQRYDVLILVLVDVGLGHYQIH